LLWKVREKRTYANFSLQKKKRITIGITAYRDNEGNPVDLIEETPPGSRKRDTSPRPPPKQTKNKNC